MHRMLLKRFDFAEFARPLFSDRVAMAWADPREPMQRLIGDEELALGAVNTARAREFAAGRAAARQAMAQLGHAPRPVLQGESLAPVWPAGLTGSITHAPQDTVAVVTDDPEIRALGLKISDTHLLPYTRWADICTMAELRWLGTLGPSQRGHFAGLLECIKIAITKASFQAVAAMPGWHEIEVAVDLGTNHFRVQLHAAEDQFELPNDLSGRFALLSQAYIAGVVWR